jgi:hypothetical protein
LLGIFAILSIWPIVLYGSGDKYYGAEVRFIFDYLNIGNRGGIKSFETNIDDA